MKIHQYTTNQLIAELRSRDTTDRFDLLMEAVEQVFHVTQEKILSSCREKEESLARICAMSILSKYHTLKKTAEAFCRLDHSTIIHAKKRCEYLKRTNDVFADRFDRVLDLFISKQTNK